MTITYSLAPNPKWYIADLVGKPLGAGFMYTYSSLDKTSFKFVFMDPAGAFPWTDPIRFDENGSQGPFYFQEDSANPNDTYYIEIYDRNMVLQWTIDNFSPGTGGGGGGSVTTAIDLQNYVVNNAFINNIESTISSLPATPLFLAPSNHAIFCGTQNPDITFTKNISGGADMISFPRFPLGTYPLIGDVTPQYYMNYTCTNNPPGEIFKQSNYPIVAGVQNLSNTAVTITLWARIAAPGANNLTLFFTQFFGDGVGASPTVITPITTLTLGTNWQKFIITTTVPSVAATTLGTCLNDCLYINVGFPLSLQCSIDHVKLSMYLGNIAPPAGFQANDSIHAIIDAPRTGSIIQNAGNTAYYTSSSSWVPLNDGTIGLPTSNPTTRGNIDTFPLYDFLWNSIPGLQVFDSTGMPISRGISSIADFENDNALQLPFGAGRVFGAVSTTHSLGQAIGEEAHTLTIPEIPSHNHPGSVVGIQTGNGGGVGNITMLSGGSTPLNIAPQGGGGPHNNIQPTTYLNSYIKL